MITINLLPQDLRKKEQKQVTLPSGILYILPVAFALLIIIQLYLGCALLAKTIQYNSLNRAWTKLTSERQQVDIWKRKNIISSQQSVQINKMLQNRVTIADKMQTLAVSLPNGIWFNRLNLKHKEFTLTGSVVSSNKDQMRLLNTFLSSLKQDAVFYDDFDRLELGRMSMRTLGGFSVMDFVLEGDLR